MTLSLRAFKPRILIEVNLKVHINLNYGLPFLVVF
jgi:hypothetical protein